MRIYIAGPYGDHNTKAKRLKNVNKARDKARELVTLGYNPYVPHFTHYLAEGWKAQPGKATWLAMDVDWLLACEAVLMLEGWEESEGARLERAIAEQFGIPVYESIAALQGAKCE